MECSYFLPKLKFLALMVIHKKANSVEKTYIIARIRSGVGKTAVWKNAMAEGKNRLYVCIVE